MSTDGVTVVWTTDKPSLSWIELAPDGSDSFYQQERPKYYETTAGRKRANQTLHRIRINGLNPGTTYRYRIFSQEVTAWTNHNYVTYGSVASSNVYSKKPLAFTTFAEKKDEVSFLVLNDIHGRADFMKDLCKDVSFKSLDFVALNGDMANSLESEEQMFTDFIDASVEMYASEIPIVYTRGNHETRGVFADEMIKYFPTRDGHFYQMFSIGDVCFLVLDGGEDKPDNDIEYSGIADFDRYREEQAKWLEKCVQTEEFKKAKYRIVLLHIPPTVGTWHGNYHLQQTVMPILNNSNIDIMFSGHTHRYSFNEPNDKAKFPILVNDNQCYILCKVDGNKIVVEVVGLDNKNKKQFEFPAK
jgi:predicted phosphodiesterase